jgi:hypothetical protein
MGGIMRTPARRTANWLTAGAGALILGVAGVTAATALPASAATTTASVSIDAGRTLSSWPAAGIGMNVAVWDARMNDPATATLLRNAGVTAVRYPGGGYADGYHWQTHTVEGGGFVAANTEFDKYVATAHAAGAEPIVTANYGSGTPQEAADWVRDANITKGDHIKYWEIGNELYGNGQYGATWETDHHASHSPTTYATGLLDYISAMKAVDPSIKIGAVLTTPGAWPDGIVGPGDTMDWNHSVLSIAGSRIDFVIVHNYPFSTSEAELLTKPQAEAPAMASALRSLINQYGGARAASIGIAVTEGNSQFDVDTSPAGLYASDNYLTWLDNGAFTFDWWDLRNGTDCSKVTTVQGATDYNDGGVLSSGAGCEPAADTPFAPYYGIQMVNKLGGPGDALVRATASTPLVSAHAVKHANGDVAVMLINKDPNNDVTVNLSYAGFNPATGAPTVDSYLKNASSIGSVAAGSATTQTVPAYSIAVVHLRRGDGTSPTPTPTATPTGTPTGTPSPTGGTGTCRVTYTKSEWQGGLVADVTISNTGSSAVNGWRLGFTFPGDTKLTSAWNATATQSGNAVTATNMSYNAAIQAGGSQSFGFQGTWTSNDANPTGFTLNGAACASG